jgi:hypothetical protein
MRTRHQLPKGRRTPSMALFVYQAVPKEPTPPVRRVVMLHRVYCLNPKHKTARAIQLSDLWEPEPRFRTPIEISEASMGSARQTKTYCAKTAANRSSVGHKALGTGQQNLADSTGVIVLGCRLPRFPPVFFSIATHPHPPPRTPQPQVSSFSSSLSSPSPFSSSRDFLHHHQPLSPSQLSF